MPNRVFHSNYNKLCNIRNTADHDRWLVANQRRGRPFRVEIDGPGQARLEARHRSALESFAKPANELCSSHLPLDFKSRDKAAASPNTALPIPISCENKKFKRKVAVVLCAQDEAERIGPVLEVLTSHPKIDEVIVVDDGSLDATAMVAECFCVHLIRIESNQGKGWAMNIGILATSADVLLLCDADIRGLTHKGIDDILTPVLTGKCKMMVAMRDRSSFVTPFLGFLPVLGGERALTRELWGIVPAAYKNGFMIEIALNFFARKLTNGFGYKLIPGLGQVTKLQKSGWRTGSVAYAKMWAHVLYSYARLQFHWHVGKPLRRRLIRFRARRQTLAYAK